MNNTFNFTYMKKPIKNFYAAPQSVCVEAFASREILETSLGTEGLGEEKIYSFEDYIIPEE